MSQKLVYIAVIAVTAIAVGNIAVSPIAVFGIPTAIRHVYAKERFVLT